MELHVTWAHDYPAWENIFLLPLHLYVVVELTLGEWDMRRAIFWSSFWEICSAATDSQTEKKTYIYQRQGGDKLGVWD